MTASGDRPTAPMVVVRPGLLLAGRYELERILGSGGMAVVWLARDRVLDRDVAVKILREQYATDPVFLSRFTSEALHAARLSHPGLVMIFDAGVDQGTAFLVMEVVHGRTLQEVLRSEGPIAVGRAVLVAADVCDVLDVAHRAGIVHRDIKPGNILISDNGSTRVFDFGIARSGESAALTQTATVIGTAAYLSPEQAAGRPAVPQSDLYSVGCVLDEMLTGAPPFTSETPVATLYQHVHDTPPTPSRARPEVNQDLDAVVLHLLAKDPADRPANAAEARQELLAVRTEAPMSTRVLTAIMPTSGQERSGRWRVLAVVAACLLVVAATTALLLDRPSQGTSAAAGSPSQSRTSSTRASSSAPSASPSDTIPTTASRSASGTAALVVPRATSAVAALAVFRNVVLTARRAALVDGHSAEQLLASAEDVAKALDKGNGKGHGKGKGKSAVPRSRELVSRVTSLVDSGRVAPAAVDPLQQAANQVLRLVTEAG